MSSTQPVFDPEKYKKTTEAQWDVAAEAWHRWGPLLAEWLGPATELMFDMAAIKPGCRVLDVACGAGEQTITAARRVGETGYVLATDLSQGILEFAAMAAAEAGLKNVETKVLDGENLDTLPQNSFDAVISRVGMIYFPDQQKALKGMRHVLKEGGRAAAMVYSTADRNQFFSNPVSIIRRKANLPAPLPGQPGPFSLGAEGVLVDAFKQAGFKDVISETVDAPVMLSSAKECLRFEKESFGALHQMLSGLSEREQQEVWDEIETDLKQFESDGAFRGPCELIIVAGTK
ncbi:MAG: methyltransferase domain-containing protein [Candidatus Dadabacteria bacterium]|nr:MAG: methyltransferase domain-containing protein [Candidatus Dadabacteria bacterium]